MQCTRCQHENAAGAKFCGECGARLEALCAACRTVNPPANKFCQECGAAMGKAEPVTGPTDARLVDPVSPII